MKHDLLGPSTLLHEHRPVALDDTWNCHELSTSGFAMFRSCKRRRSPPVRTIRYPHNYAPHIPMVFPTSTWAYLTSSSFTYQRLHLPSPGGFLSLDVFFSLDHRLISRPHGPRVQTESARKLAATRPTPSTKFSQFSSTGEEP